MRRYMIDLETLGCAPDAVILSIGLVEFDIYGAIPGTELYLELHTDSQEDNTVDLSTVRWWVDQLKLGNTIPWNGATTPYAACLELDKVLKGNTGEIWANGTDFDIPKLQHLFTSNGCDIPWKYNQVRDLRTLAALFPEIAWPENAQKHNALQDAICQADHAAQLLRMIGELS